MLQHWTSTRSVLNSIDDKEDWATHRDELRACCFSTNKTRVHAADLLSNFRHQHANENLRVIYTSI